MKKITFKLKNLAVLLLLAATSSLAQQTQKCATDELMEIERQKNPTLFDQNRAQIEAFTANYKLSHETLRTPNTIVQIPTVVHVVHNGEAVGTYPNISDAQINSAIANLNAAYKNQGAPYAGSVVYNSPMDVEFVYAQVNENGTTTTGIERHDVSSKSYSTEYNNNGIQSNPGGVGVPSKDLFVDYFYNPQDYMNIWIVKKIGGVDTGTGQAGVLGYATLPLTFPGVTDGLVCQARAFGYNPAYNSSNPGATPGFDFGTSSSPSSGNGTADHEVGHYLNLHHTFNGDQGGSSCPPSSGTVGTDDDGCADIEPHKRTNSVCPADNATGNTCTGGNNEYIHNFMNYSNDPCFTGFSNDQRTRVHAAIAGPRVAFNTSIAGNAPSGAYPAAVSMTPVSTAGSIASLGIFEVALNGTTYKSRSAHNDGFYINRVASQPTTALVAATQYAMTVKVGVDNGSTNRELVDVYIDYNNDGAFSSTERIYQTPGGSGKINDTFSFNFTTPATGGFPFNQRLRMRVISGFDNGNNSLGSAYSTDVGNIEDYSVMFSTPASVDENVLESSNIVIYPNPANSVLNIKNSTNKKLTAVTIFDSLGRKVYSDTSTDKISVEGLGDGIYFLKLEFDNNNTITKRFVKK